MKGKPPTKQRIKTAESTVGKVITLGENQNFIILKYKTGIYGNFEVLKVMLEHFVLKIVSKVMCLILVSKVLDLCCCCCYYKCIKYDER